MLGPVTGSWDQRGIMSGTAWRADCVGPPRALAFTVDEMGRHWRLSSTVGLMYVAGNKCCSFFLLLKHPEATNRYGTSSSAIDGVFSTQPEDSRYA